MQALKEPLMLANIFIRYLTNFIISSSKHIQNFRSFKKYVNPYYNIDKK
jgi:hypothetical protein